MMVWLDGQQTETLTIVLYDGMVGWLANWDVNYFVI